MWDWISDAYFDWESYWADFFLPFDVQLGSEGTLDTESSDIVSILIVSLGVMIVAGILAWYAGILTWIRTRIT